MLGLSCRTLVYRPQGHPDREDPEYHRRTQPLASRRVSPVTAVSFRSAVS